MRSIEIETWAIKIIERVLENKPNEDARVELKSVWPVEKPESIARQIAGHANAARGEPVLWIIGVQQSKRKILGVEHLEVSTWYEKIKSKFVDQHAPTLKDVYFEFEGKIIAALLFDTERFPFLVKHTNEISEVPWREGTLTRSAKRSELLKLLIPLQLLPQITVMDAKVEIREFDKKRHDWYYKVEFYIEPASEKPIVIPFHRCNAEIELKNLGISIPIPDIKLMPPYTAHGFFSRIESKNLSKTIEYSPDELLVYGPGRIIFSGSFQIEELPPNLNRNKKLRVLISIWPIGSQQMKNIIISLNKITTSVENSPRHKWALLSSEKNSI